uniref:Major facilitator superfamily (MFS) profile domain-containing protein n=1 Tax=Rhodnius prolixus TaxID=13249 RepID=T1HDV7_RHOPR
MVAIGYAVVHINRYNLSLAIVSMTDKKSSNENFYEFNWNEREKGALLSSFFWGYVLSQVAAGQIAQSISPKLLLTITTSISALLAAVSPLASYIGGWQLLIAIRITDGLCQKMKTPWMKIFTSIPFWALIFTAMSASCLIMLLVGFFANDIIPFMVILIIAIAFHAFLFSSYLITPLELASNFAGIIYALTNTADNLSAALAPIVTGMTVDNPVRFKLKICLFNLSAAASTGILSLFGALAQSAGGWPSIFYVSALLTLLWTISWAWLAADSPATHKTISSEEKMYIETSLKNCVDFDKAIDGTLLKPTQLPLKATSKDVEEYNKSLIAYNRVEYYAQGLIASRVTPEERKLINMCTTSKHMWDKLHSIYEQRTEQR